MLKPEQVPSEVIRKAMHTFQVQMDEEEHSVGQSWAIILAAALKAWPHVALSTHVDEGRRIILPLTQEGEG